MSDSIQLGTFNNLGSIWSQSEPNRTVEVFPGGVPYPKNDRIGFFLPRSVIFLLLLSLTSPSTQTELEVAIL